MIHLSSMLATASEGPAAVLRCTSPAETPSFLLVEDNTARKIRNPGGSLKGNTDIVVRVHRVQGAETSVVAEYRYKPGDLRHDVKRRDRAAIALDLIDSVRPGRGVVIAAGPCYGSSASFLKGLAQRGLEFVVEIKPSQSVNIGGLRKNAAAAVPRRGWRRIELKVPHEAAPKCYSFWNGGIVSVPASDCVQFISAQIGGVSGLHRGTIFVVTSLRRMAEHRILGIAGWIRWIRTTTRRAERQTVTDESVTRADSSSSGPRCEILLRTNIRQAQLLDRRNADAAEPVRAAPLQGVLAARAPLLNVAEVFAGAGGIGLGFLLARRNQARYRLTFSGEINPIYVGTLRTNHAAYAAQSERNRECVPAIAEPVNLAAGEGHAAVRRAVQRFGRVDVLVGGPPCQGFSAANRNSGCGSNPHNRLVDVYLKYVEALRPSVFVMENVQGILWAVHQGSGNRRPTVVDHLAKRMRALGYLVFPKLLDATWYGVPQFRSRFFLVGIHKSMGYSADDFGDQGPFPSATHGPGCARPYVSVRDAIADLPRVGNGSLTPEMRYDEPSERMLRANRFLAMMRTSADRRTILDHITSNHAPYVIDRYRRIPEGGNWESIAHMLTNYTAVGRTHSNIYRRLGWDQPAITIGHYRKSMLVHPGQHRGLSLREASRLQSFPDWFRFSGGETSSGLAHKQQQLANAVCPLVAKAIAEFVLKL